MTTIIDATKHTPEQVMQIIMRELSNVVKPAEVVRINDYRPLGGSL